MSVSTEDTSSFLARTNISSPTFRLSACLLRYLSLSRVELSLLNAGETCVRVNKDARRLPSL